MTRRSCCDLNHFKSLEQDVECCVYCGTVYFATPPAVPYRKEVKPPAYDDRTKAKIYYIVKNHYLFITELLQSQITWEVIARRLRERAKVSRLEWVKVREYYLFVGERDGTEKPLSKTED